MRKLYWVTITGLVSGMTYWMLYDEASFNDELTFVIQLSFSLAVFFLFVKPLTDSQRKTEQWLRLTSEAAVTGERINSVNDLVIQYRNTVEAVNQFVKSVQAEKPSLISISANSAVSSALTDLKQYLTDLSEKEEQTKWISESTSKFIDILKSSYQEEQEFHDNVLLNLVKFVDANQGAMFLPSSSDGHADYLEMVACYAYGRKKHLGKKIAAGEGILGQAYLEANTVLLKQVPENYVKVTSGLGQSLPRELVIIPMKLNEVVVGLVEFASFEEFPPYKISFIEKVGESIASTLETSRINKQTKDLLQQAQQNSEELRSQEEEMRQNMEELEATQEEMARKEKELTRMLNDAEENKRMLNSRLQEIENLKKENEDQRTDVIQILNAIPAKIFLKDAQGNMVLCNDEVARAYNLTIDELIGTHDKDHFDPKQAKEFREQEIDVMNTGVQTFLQEERLNGKVRYLKTTKMPFYIKHLNQTGLLGYQFDVSETYKP